MKEILAEKKDIIIETEENNSNNAEKKKSFTILGISIWRLFAYFILYSIAGYIIETAFGALTKGVIESRKSFLYGPFCAIYGLGAVVMILFLQYFKKNNFTLFFGGFFIGSVVEYIVSWVGEYFMHIKWWDYSNIPFNLNGRICVFFSLFWGILAIFLMSYFNPKMDHVIDKIKRKIPHKLLKVLTATMIILMFLDFLVTGFALRMFFTRLVDTYHLELQNGDEYLFDCEKIYQNKQVSDLVYKYFSDEKMLKTFPNIKMTGKDGNIIYVSDILKNIQPYYFRIFTPRIPKLPEKDFSIQRQE